MSKKALPRIAPLQRVIAEPITDPAEQAALDKARKREKQKQGRRNPKTKRHGARTSHHSSARTK